MSYATEIANQMRIAKRTIEFANDLTSDLVQSSFLRLVDKGEGTIDRFITKFSMTSRFSLFMK